MLRSFPLESAYSDQVRLETGMGTQLDNIRQERIGINDILSDFLSQDVKIGYLVVRGQAGRGIKSS
jgi:hypothetical protein